MTNFKKHEQSVDVQVRTRFYDKTGAELHGVIEYDINTGYGKRVKLDSDPKQGIIEPFYCGDGILEVDGNAFDKTHGYDEDKLDAIITMIGMNLSRNANPRAYEEMMQHLTNINRHRVKPRPTPSPPGPPEPQAQPSGLYDLETARMSEKEKDSTKKQIPSTHKGQT